MAKPKQSAETESQPQEAALDFETFVRAAMATGKPPKTPKPLKKPPAKAKK
jgi:hypothetical protein